MVAVGYVIVHRIILNWLQKWNWEVSSLSQIPNGSLMRYIFGLDNGLYHWILCDETTFLHFLSIVIQWLEWYFLFKSFENSGQEIKHAVLAIQKMTTWCLLFNDMLHSSLRLHPIRSNSVQQFWYSLLLSCLFQTPLIVNGYITNICSIFLFYTQSLKLKYSGVKWNIAILSSFLAELHIFLSGFCVINSRMLT